MYLNCILKLHCENSCSATDFTKCSQSHYKRSFTFQNVLVIIFFEHFSEFPVSGFWNDQKATSGFHKLFFDSIGSFISPLNHIMGFELENSGYFSYVLKSGKLVHIFIDVQRTSSIAFYVNQVKLRCKNHKRLHTKCRFKELISRKI